MRVLSICFVTAVMALSSDAYAGSRCPAGEMGCTEDNMQQKMMERVEKGTKDIIKERGVTRRVEKLGNVINDCFQCMGEAISDSVESSSTGR